MTLDDFGAGSPIGPTEPDGFLGQLSFIHKRLIGGAIGLLTGGPGAAITGFLDRGGRRPRMPNPGGALTVVAPQARVVRDPSLRGRISAILPGGDPGLMVEGSPTIGCASGYHPNRSEYFLRSGEFVARGSRCVKNRRRNPMNPRALSRAIARVDSGKALQGKLAEISTRKYTAAGKRKDHH